MSVQAACAPLILRYLLAYYRTCKHINGKSGSRLDSLRADGTGRMRERVAGSGARLQSPSKEPRDQVR
jgi:hypothetical protein